MPRWCGHHPVKLWQQRGLPQHHHWPCRRRALTGFNHLAAQAALTNYGGDCHNYALLAAGHIDLVMEDSLAPHDMIAVVAVMQAAGAVVTDTAGQPIRLGQSSSILAAATADLHAAALTALAEVAAD
jgi:fructose-1,6-bisphosphatase/inositol monophosphatase family enzyme